MDVFSKNFIIIFVLTLIFIPFAAMFRYKKMDEPYRYNGQEIRQRYDRYLFRTEVYYQDKWMMVEGWKSEIDSKK